MLNLKTGSNLMGNLPKPLAKIVLIPLRLTAAASAANAGILKQTSRSGMTTLITSNEEMDDHLKKLIY